MVQQGQDRDSTVYVYVAVAASSGVDLTGDSCLVAFVPTGSRPVSGDWVTAQIVAGNTVRILVGDYNNPTGVPIASNPYCEDFPAQLDMWVDIIDLPERPKAPVGTWTVT